MGRVFAKIYKKPTHTHQTDINLIFHEMGVENNELLLVRLSRFVICTHKVHLSLSEIGGAIPYSREGIIYMAKVYFPRYFVLRIIFLSLMARNKSKALS